MRKYVWLVLALVLTVSVLSGCGCTKKKMDTSPDPTILPTNEEIWDSTAPTNRPTVETTAPTMTTAPSETYDRGNGPLEDTTGSTDDTGNTTQTTDSVSPRSSGVIPGMR